MTHGKVNCSFLFLAGSISWILPSLWFSISKEKSSWSIRSSLSFSKITSTSSKTVSYWYLGQKKAKTVGWNNLLFWNVASYWYVHFGSFKKGSTSKSHPIRWLQYHLSFVLKSNCLNFISSYSNVVLVHCAVRQFVFKTGLLAFSLNQSFISEALKATLYLSSHSLPLNWLAGLLLSAYLEDTEMLISLSLSYFYRFQHRRRERSWKPFGNRPKADGSSSNAVVVVSSKFWNVQRRQCRPLLTILFRWGQSKIFRPLLRLLPQVLPREDGRPWKWTGSDGRPSWGRSSRAETRAVGFVVEVVAGVGRIQRLRNWRRLKFRRWLVFLCSTIARLKKPWWWFSR